MKQRASLGFFIAVAVIVVAGGAGLASQWRETMTLRGELELARIETSELEQLRVENRHLRARQISAAELEALRADHAALPRLRAEIEALNKSSPAARP